VVGRALVSGGGCGFLWSEIFDKMGSSEVVNILQDLTSRP